MPPLPLIPIAVKGVSLLTKYAIKFAPYYAIKFGVYYTVRDYGVLRLYRRAVSSLSSRLHRAAHACAVRSLKQIERLQLTEHGGGRSRRA